MKKVFLFIVLFISFALIHCTNSLENTSQTSETINYNISASQAYKLVQNSINDTNIIIVDVRTEAEYNSGHIKNAININFFDPNFEDKINQLDKTKTYLIYCASGSRSSQAFKIFKQLNFTKVYNLEGGISAWLEKGYDIEK